MKSAHPDCERKLVRSEFSSAASSGVRVIRETTIQHGVIVFPCLSPISQAVAHGEREELLTTVAAAHYLSSFLLVLSLLFRFTGATRRQSSAEIAAVVLFLTRSAMTPQYCRVRDHALQSHPDLTEP